MPHKIWSAGKELYDYAGCIHMHSNFSDGDCTVEEIIDASKNVEIDYLVLTDHDTLEAKKRGYEGYYDGRYLFVEFEITPRFNHYLAFNLENFEGLEELKKREPQEFIDEVNERGGFGGLAHPFHIGTKKFNIPPYKWTDWSVRNFSLISIWDLMTDWQSKLKSYKDAFYGYYFLDRFLTGPLKENLRKWDELNLSGGKIVGFGEIDNHAEEHKTIVGAYSIFPFEIALRTIRTHIIMKEKLTPDVKLSKRKLYDALKNGSCYVSFDLKRSPEGFLFYGIQNEKLYLMGDEIKLQTNVELLGKFNTNCRIILLKNGIPILKHFGDFFRFQTFEEGVYRVEAYLKNKAWIFSNPIYIRY